LEAGYGGNDDPSVPRVAVKIQAISTRKACFAQNIYQPLCHQASPHEQRRVQSRAEALLLCPRIATTKSRVVYWFSDDGSLWDVKADGYADGSERRIRIYELTGALPPGRTVDLPGDPLAEMAAERGCLGAGRMLAGASGMGGEDSAHAMPLKRCARTYVKASSQLSTSGSSVATPNRWLGQSTAQLVLLGIRGSAGGAVRLPGRDAARLVENDRAPGLHPQ
jgi:hypothetical protein